MALPRFVPNISRSFCHRYSIDPGTGTAGEVNSLDGSIWVRDNDSAGVLEISLRTRGTADGAVTGGTVTASAGGAMLAGSEGGGGVNACAASEAAEPLAFLGLRRMIEALCDNGVRPRNFCSVYAVVYAVTESS